MSSRYDGQGDPENLVRCFKEACSAHENTVRFRVAKARELLGLKNEPYTFIERTSLALKAERLLAPSFSLLFPHHLI